MTDSFFPCLFLALFIPFCFLQNIGLLHFFCERNILLDFKWAFEIKRPNRKNLAPSFCFHKRRGFLDQLSNFNLIMKEPVEHSYRCSLPCF